MKTDNVSGSRLGVPATATLLRRFHEQCPRTEIYDKAIRCYETLIETVQNTSVSREIAALLHVPPSTVISEAEKIITLLLFNEENDPYLSLGLGRHATFQEVNGRWKGLISLYHPDRHLHQEPSEDKARKINEVHEEIRGAQGKKGPPLTVRHFSEMDLPENNTVFLFTYLKSVPYLIIGIAVAIALFSLSFFIYDLISANPSPSPGGKEKALKIIPADRNKDTNNIFQ